MKIILSRKGFDSSVGGVASPIFPNGRMVSLPIPDTLGTRRVRELTGPDIGFPTADFASIICSLTRGSLSQDQVVHVDPDLDDSVMPRQRGWRPAFGQAQAAQTHLDNQGVGPGDLFLFYGWFRRVRLSDNQWFFEQSAPDLHVIFGWLQVGERIEIPPGTEASVLARHPWLADHPHLHVPPSMLRGKNVVYVATDSLTLAGTPTGLRGGGVFRTLSARRVLTETGAPLRSLWRVPRWFEASDGLPPLSYHSDPCRWTDAGDSLKLSTVGRGQEFVLDCSKRTDASGWIAGLWHDLSALDERQYEFLGLQGTVGGVPSI